MALIRVEKSKNYTVMSNYHLKDKNLSLKAKGLLSFMLSLPDDWDYSIDGLVSLCKENEGSIKSILNELKAEGYLQVIKKLPNQTKSGRIEYEYIIYECKQSVDNSANEQKVEKLTDRVFLTKTRDKKQGVEKQEVEKQGVENHPLQNTNIINTNIINTKRLNTKRDVVDTISNTNSISKGTPNKEKTTSTSSSEIISDLSLLDKNTSAKIKESSYLMFWFNSGRLTKRWLDKNFRKIINGFYSDFVPDKSKAETSQPPTLLKTKFSDEFMSSLDSNLDTIEV